MFYIVSYDIPDDNKRTKIANICKNHGLERLQYSVFAGKTTQNMIETLVLRAKEVLDRSLGAVIVVPICKNCLEKIISLGRRQVGKKSIEQLIAKKHLQVVIA